MGHDVLHLSDCHIDVSHAAIRHLADNVTQRAEQATFAHAVTEIQTKNKQKKQRFHKILHCKIILALMHANSCSPEHTNTQNTQAVFP